MEKKEKTNFHLLLPINQKTPKNLENQTQTLDKNAILTPKFEPIEY